MAEITPRVGILDRERARLARRARFVARKALLVPDAVQLAPVPLGGPAGPRSRVKLGGCCSAGGAGGLWSM